MITSPPATGRTALTSVVAPNAVGEKFSDHSGAPPGSYAQSIPAETGLLSGYPQISAPATRS